MTGFWYILLGLTLTSALKASPITDPYVKNLTLIGVIHVEGARAKSQSVAVLRDRFSGKTRMLHKGDSIADADLEVRELGRQHITLARGQQTFVLRVESQSEAATASVSTHVESTDVELMSDKSLSPVAELSPPAEVNVETIPKPETQAEQRRLIPDADCTNEECAEAAE
jgi:hypothetical protein